MLMMTTGPTGDFKVEEYRGVVSAQVVVGTGLLTDVFSSFTDLFGAGSKSYQGKLERINDQALRGLRAKARRIGANAIVGLRVDHDEVSGGGKSMLMVTASGTAVTMHRVGSVARTDLGAAVSAHEVRTARTRAHLISAAHDSRLATARPEVWDFLCTERVHEVGVAVVSDVLRRHSSTPDAAGRRLAEYFHAIGPECATDVAFQALAVIDDHGLRTFADLVVAHDLAAPSKIVDLLRSEDLRRRSVGISLLRGDVSSYDRAELDALRECARLLEALPPALASEKTKLFGGTDTVWTCACTRDVVGQDRCVCGLDRFGAHRDFDLEAARREVAAKIAAVQELLEGGAEPLNRQNAADG